MKRETMQIPMLAVVAIHPSVSVRHVPDERMRKVPQMAANLVQTPRLWLRLDKRASLRWRSTEEPHLGHGMHTWPILCTRDVILNTHVVLYKLTSDKRDVRLVDAALFETFREERRAHLRSREHERSTRAAVETMDRINMCTERIANAKESNVRVPAPATMNEEPGRFAHDDDVLIEMEQLDARQRF